MKDIKERIVVKIGTSTLTYENGRINIRRLEQICRVLSDLINSGYEVVLVTSGAMGVGIGKIGISERPKEIEKKQAVAAIGQCELMFMYDKFFSEYSQVVAQILLTKSVTDNEISSKNVKNTFNTLLGMGILPIVNENDSVETAEIEGQNFGDNDMLSAIVSRIICADRLIIFTDTDGLYENDPRVDSSAKRIHRVDEITDSILKIAGGRGSSRGTGGMSTKLSAARYATQYGVQCHITNGNRMKNIYDILDGKEKGTVFLRNEAKK